MSSGPPPPDHSPPPVPDSDALKAKYAEIAALKKSIEEKRMVQHANTPIPSWYGGSGGYAASAGFGYRGRGSYRGRGRGVGRVRGNSFGWGGSGRGRYQSGSGHRNMTLVFDNGGSSSGSSAADGIATETDGAAAPDAAMADSAPKPADPSYVTSITSSGMTLINSAIYEQDALARQKQIDATNQLKEQLKQRKIQRILQSKVQMKRAKTDCFDRVRISSQTFAVTSGGLVLKLISEPSHESPSSQEQVVQWNNLSYVRQANGDLICPAVRGRAVQNHCIYFTKTGFCQKGSNCPYQHDANHIRLCRQSLTGACHNPHCLLSHKRTQFNTPVCRYYLDDKCSNSQCVFQHSKPEHYGEPNTEIWACRPFAVGGACSRGLRCPFLHLYICPDFQEEGTCPRGKSCTLSHPITQSTQMLMLNHVEGERDDDVLVESEGEDAARGSSSGSKRSGVVGSESAAAAAAAAKTIISSYTVNPDVLFDRGMDDKYSFYIDTPASSSGSNSATGGPVATDSAHGGDANTYVQDKEFMIHLESSDSEADDLEENNDYVQFEEEADEGPQEQYHEQALGQDQNDLIENSEQKTYEHEELEF